MKKLQSYTNDYYVYFINEWFNIHDILTKEQYEMLKGMVCFMRDKKKME